jgi:transglutaminase-like putative cysteine protease
VSFDDGRTETIVHCEGVVENTNTTGIIGKQGGFAPLWLFQRPTDLTAPATMSAGWRRPPATFRRRRKLHALSRLIGESVKYKTGQTHPGTTAEEALDIGAGVCQDHAQIFVAAARAMGYPARYVSGYLMMNDRVDQDATHAWAEAHVEGRRLGRLRRIERHFAR